MKEETIYRLFEYGSPEYEAELSLRNSVLRIPIGMDLYDEDLGNDAYDYHVGAFVRGNLVGCLLLSGLADGTIKMRQVAVREELRRKGIGKGMVGFSERFALDEGFEKMTLHARKEAVGFYRRLGYETAGEEFTEVGIPHYEMEKSLITTKLEMKKVNESNIYDFSSVLTEAAEWMISMGFENWNPNSLTAERIIDDCSLDELFICHIDGKTAGCLRLQQKDGIFWPEYPDDDALYIHKLAVRRAYSGKGVASFMIGWAKDKAREQGRKYLRLDCIADRKKLCEFYERNGFMKIDEIDATEFGPSARYELKV